MLQILSIWLLFSEAAFAGPAVSSIALQANSVVVAGTGFGTDEGASTPIFWDSFDSGSNGAELVKQQAGTLNWTLNASPKAKYTDTQKHSGTLSAYALHTSANQWSFFTVGSAAAPLPYSLRYYHTFWFRYNTPRPLGTTGETKLIRMFGDVLLYGNPDRPYIKTGGVGTWWFTVYRTETAANETTKNHSKEPTENTWHRVEALYRQSSAGGTPDGAIKIIIDGQTQVDVSNVMTRESPDKKWITADFFGGMTNWDTNNTGLRWEKWIDDAYLGKSWQRVELCDSPTWIGRTHCELQPVLAWADGKITAALNSGSFSNGQTVYLYVVDGNDLVSNSSSIKLQSGTTTPLAPKNLQAH